VEPQHFARLVDRIQHTAAKYLAELMKAILERRDDPKISATAARTPEQIRVLFLTRLEQPPICGNDI
jgi:hypothetical protein